MVVSCQKLLQGSLVSDGVAAVMGGGIILDTLVSADEQKIIDLIRRSLDGFTEAGSVLAATYRRLEKLYDTYNQEGCRFIVVKDLDHNTCIGAAGLAPLAGLPPSDGVGEIRDVVVDESYRGRGIGRMLLERALDEARRLGYKRIYLETTPQMEKAQKLFLNFGFTPVKQQQHTPGKEQKEESFPCYYLLHLVPAEKEQD
jgi:putative acetyltransferase